MLNVRSPSGEPVSAAEVEKLAGLRGMQIRTGCVCNVGACQSSLGMSDADVMHNYEVRAWWPPAVHPAVWVPDVRWLRVAFVWQAGHMCWDDNDIVDGRATGAVRVSFGYMSSQADADAFVAFVSECFVVARAPPLLPTADATGEPPGEGGDLVLHSIHLYPVKSCAAQTVTQWPLGPYGLLYDREWSVADPTGTVLNQKACARLALIKPLVDAATGSLTLSAPGMEPVTVPGFLPGGDTSPLGSRLQQVPAKRVTVCGQACSAMPATVAGGSTTAVDAWLQAFLGRKCTLLRADHSHVRLAGHRPEQHGGRRRARGEAGAGSGAGAGSRAGAADATSPVAANRIGFANEGQFLAVGMASVANLQQRVRDRHTAKAGSGAGHGSMPGGPVTVTPAFFRPNFVFAGGAAFDEDMWRSITIGGVPFSVSGRVWVPGTGRRLHSRPSARPVALRT